MRVKLWKCLEVDMTLVFRLQLTSHNEQACLEQITSISGVTQAFRMDHHQRSPPASSASTSRPPSTPVTGAMRALHLRGESDKENIQPCTEETGHDHVDDNQHYRMHPGAVLPPPQSAGGAPTAVQIVSATSFESHIHHEDLLDGNHSSEEELEEINKFEMSGCATVSAASLTADEMDDNDDDMATKAMPTMALKSTDKNRNNKLESGSSETPEVDGNSVSNSSSTSSASASGDEAMAGSPGVESRRCN